MSEYIITVRQYIYIKYTWCVRYITLEEFRVRLRKCMICELAKNVQIHEKNGINVLPPMISYREGLWSWHDMNYVQQETLIVNDPQISFVDILQHMRNITEKLADIIIDSDAAQNLFHNFDSSKNIDGQWNRDGTTTRCGLLRNMGKIIRHCIRSYPSMIMAECLMRGVALIEPRNME